MTKAKLYEELKKFQFPRQKRSNVLKKGDVGYNGFVLGIVQQWNPTYKKVLSSRTKKPKYKDIYALARAEIKKAHPDFKYNSIQFNKSYKMAKHKDANNVGESYILGVGNYTGGELIIYDKDGKNPKKKDIKNKWFKYNGSLFPHEVAGFTGDRYSIVYYKT